VVVPFSPLRLEEQPFVVFESKLRFLYLRLTAALRPLTMFRPDWLVEQYLHRDLGRSSLF
jgi:hypothetical protein